MDRDTSRAIWQKIGMNDDDIKLIENYKFRHGSLFVERRNRGYTLIHAQTGAPIARLRPGKQEQSFEILYWSLGKLAWVPFGPFGKTVASLEDALQIIAANSIFWAVL